MGDIFQEVNEELRQERLEKLWKAYGKYVVAAVVAAVLMVGGFRGWQEYRLKQREAESAQFATAVNLLEEGKNKEAAALFASLAENASNSYAALARFHQAAMKAKEGDPAGAAALYDALAADEGVSEPLRQAARLLGVMQAMDLPDADAKALAAKLGPLVSARGPWRSTASELSGLLALKSGDPATARERFKSITDDPDAPPNARARAAEMLAMIGD